MLSNSVAMAVADETAQKYLKWHTGAGYYDRFDLSVDLQC